MEQQMESSAQHRATPRLDVSGVSKHYGSVNALDDVSMSVQPGEVMALLGQNGAGKSTLVRILSGLEGADVGETRINGVIVDLGSAKKAQAAGIAVVQQEISAARNMTVAENLVLGDSQFPWLWRRGALRAKAVDLLRRVGLAHIDPFTTMGDLSIGEMQLIEIARVLSRDAQVIVFDEPTAALSDAEIKRILQLIRTLASEGRSIIYVTHRLKEVFLIADRVTVLRGGRLRTCRPTAELSVDAVVEAMVGREVGSLFPKRGDLGEVLLSVRQLAVPGLPEHVHFDVRAGEILGLTGQLGSGAARVVQALAGLVPGTIGEVTVGHRALRLGRRRAGLSTGIAYCSDDRKCDGMFADLSVTKNLSSPWLGSVAPWGLISRRREASQATEAAVSFTVDRSRIGSKVGVLSGGNQQKVALAKWIGSQPRVLLVHEPTRGVDVGARAEIYERLRELCRGGMAVIVVSSDAEEVLGLSDTIMTFYRGRLTAARAHGDWTEAELVREVVHEEAAA
jgi:ABC-type sugar transport system ATPase subunit